MIPGELRLSRDPLPQVDREVCALLFVNDGDRPIQIGSHLHLPLANEYLRFDRSAADGFRLDIAAGTSVRFEPGVSRKLSCVRLHGTDFGSGSEQGRHE